MFNLPRLYEKENQCQIVIIFLSLILAGFACSKNCVIETALLGTHNILKGCVKANNRAATIMLPRS